MRVFILIGILLLATTTLASTNEWDGQRPVPSTPYSYAPSGVSALANVAIFRDVLPWDSTFDDDILMANSIAFTVFGSGDIGNVDLGPFDKIIISNQQSLEFNTIVSNNRDWFDAFAENHGVLLVGLAHYSGDIPLDLPMPGGYSFVASGCNEVVTMVDSEHQVFTIPNSVSESELQGWGCSSHGDLNTPLGSMALLMSDDYTTGPALAERALGNGWVIATTQPYQYDGASFNFAENLVLYLPAGVVATENMAFSGIKCLFR